MTNTTTAPDRRQPLLTLIVTAVLAAAIGLLTALPAQAATTPTADEQSVIDSINGYRARNGRAPLAVNPSLQAASHDWAAYSAGRQRSNHDTRANVDASCAAAASDATNCGELVGQSSGTALSVVGGFAGSPGHSAVLLDDARTHIGAGAVEGSNGMWYVVVRLMHSNTAESLDPPPTTTPPTTTTPTTSPPTTQPPSEQFTTAEKFVKAVYADFLGRQPTSTELAQWSTRVSTAVDREWFVRAQAYSTEYIGVIVDGFYRVSLGRGADQSGKSYWADIIRRRVLTPAQVASHFYASDEYFRRSGSDLGTWVSDLYVQLLKRAADTAGRNYWVSYARANGRVPVAVNFYDSRETLNVRVDSLYRDLLGRGSDAAGRRHWGDVIKRSGNDVDLAVHLAVSSEYLTLSSSRY